MLLKTNTSTLLSHQNLRNVGSIPNRAGLSHTRSRQQRTGYALVHPTLHTTEIPYDVHKITNATEQPEVVGQTKK